MHIKEIDKFRVLTCLQLFVIYFGFLFVIVMNQSAQERLFMVKAFFHGLYLSSQYTFSPQIITVISFNMLQGLPHNLTVAQLLHKYPYSHVKYSQNVA